VGFMNIVFELDEDEESVTVTVRCGGGGTEITWIADRHWSNDLLKQCSVDERKSISWVPSQCVRFSAWDIQTE
jgi:hypothetical protein